MNVEQLLQTALEHHQARQWREAEMIYRQVLSHDPNHPAALHLLGVLAFEIGRPDDAIHLIRQALSFAPDYGAAHNNLGKMLTELGRLDEAIAACNKAIELQPNFAEAQNNLGIACQRKGKTDEAIGCFTKALRLSPQHLGAQVNLGNALKEKGKIEEALQAYQKALTIQEDYFEAHYNMGIALREAPGGKHNEQALVHFRRAVQIRPDHGEAWNNLGMALKQHGDLGEAVRCQKQAVALEPQRSDFVNDLGFTLATVGMLDEAIACYRRALAIDPRSAEVYDNLGVAMTRLGQLDEALGYFRKALELKGDDATFHSDLGNVLKERGEIDQAVASYWRALEGEPDSAAIHSNIIYVMHFQDGVDKFAIREEQRRWVDRHTRTVKRFENHPNSRDPNRRLKIGYVSPDFRDHVVGINLLPLFREHDHQQFEIHCYSGVPVADEVTAKFKQYADVWRDIAYAGDEQLAEMIRADGIDILVDLTLHMAYNRLLAFARQPAPVQVTFAGYPGSTGLETIQYRLTDPYLEPPGDDEEFWSEKPLRLQHSFWCYEPAGEEPEVNELPAEKTGQITFGCLNNFCKVNNSVLRLWAQVMRNVERSRLMLLASEGEHRRRTQDFLEREGVARDRIQFVTMRPRADYLALYRQIDIGLDTFPYNGHTTSLDSLWMGVPVITLSGEMAVGRAGVSQLSNLKLTELIAPERELFVKVAVDLAHDPARLRTLRAELREKMKRSPLMNAQAFTRDIEHCYRAMWSGWCSR